MTPASRNKLRELAMAAREHAPTPWTANGPIFSAAGDKFSRGSCNLERGIDSATDLSAYIAAVHPGAIIELLDAVETAEIRAVLADLYTPNETETWLTSPHPQLRGVSAAAAIRAGRFDEVAAIIERISAGSQCAACGPVRSTLRGTGGIGRAPRRSLAPTAYQSMRAKSCAKRHRNTRENDGCRANYSACQ